MDIVRFALRFPYTFYALAASIVFVGVPAIAVMPEGIFPDIKVPVVSVICAIRTLMPAGIHPPIISTVTSGVVLYFIGYTLSTMTRARGRSPDDHSDESGDVGQAIHAAADYQATLDSLSIRKRIGARNSRA